MLIAAMQLPLRFEVDEVSLFGAAEAAKMDAFPVDLDGGDEAPTLGGSAGHSPVMYRKASR
jgi:hypothetical protein